jgi:hypothetical protein
MRLAAGVYLGSDESPARVGAAGEGMSARDAARTVAAVIPPNNRTLLSIRRRQT